MLIEFMITQACVGLYGNQHAACIKAVEAASLQYNVKQSTANVEDKATKIAQSKAVSVTGPEVLAVTLFTAKVIKDREVSTLLIKNNGAMPSINTTVRSNGGQFTFGWGF
jgi:hypothetical protein